MKIVIKKATNEEEEENQAKEKQIHLQCACKGIKWEWIKKRPSWTSMHKITMQTQ